MKFLITAALSAQAYKLKQLLAEDAIFVLADHEELPAFITKDNEFLRIPKGDSATFAHELLTLCLDHQVDYLIPLRKQEIVALAETRQLFEEYEIKVVVPQTPDVSIRRSSVPTNASLIAMFKGENLLRDYSCEANFYPQTGVFVLAPDDNEVKYYIYTAD